MVVGVWGLSVDQEMPVDAGCADAALAELGMAVLVQSVDGLGLNCAVINDRSYSPAVRGHYPDSPGGYACAYCRNAAGKGNSGCS